MTTRRRFLAKSGAGLFVLVAPLTTFGQQSGTNLIRIGIASSGSAASHKGRMDAFRDGLRELGYVEGKDVLFEYRHSEGRLDRYSDLAAELVGLNPDFIVVGSTGFVAAVSKVTGTIPIVVGNAGDLVGTRLVANLARPGGNITGSTDMSADLAAKRFELLREAVPKALRIAALWYPAQGASDELEMKLIEMAAHRSGVQFQPVAVRNPEDFPKAYADMIKQRADGVIIIQGSFTAFHSKQLSELAAKHRLPSISEEAVWAESGCLLSYGPDKVHSWRRAASYVDRILKGAKPGDLPIEQPTKFELVVNMKTAKSLGVTIPHSILVRADRVIE
jgi:putative tryptophan/tyrosine transport system substrate-binding protein